MMRTASLFILCCALSLMLPPALGAQQKNDGVPPAKVSQGQRDLGTIILEDASVKDGKLSFRTATGGCTEKGSFKVNVKKEKGISDKVPHYVLSVERTARDDCKAFFPEGVVIEFDLEKDLGLKGNYTLSIANPIYPRAIEHF
jgi:hypothetical protein